MITLEELKNRLINEYNLQGDSSPCRFSSCSDSYENPSDYFNENPSDYFNENPFNNNKLLTEFYKKMMAEPYKVKEIEEQIANGEEFRCYFTNMEDMKEFVALHESDPDKFYRILRKEELFLNTCLMKFGFGNMLISLDPNKLLGDIEGMLPDEDI